MNDKTGELLEKLAQKMGTTVQYLWSVLIKQAPISSTVTIFQWGLVAIVGYILYRLHLKFNKEIAKDNYGYKTIYSQNDAAGICMIIVGVIWLLLVVACFFSVEEVVNGYFNPEYWALSKILDSTK